MILVRGCGFPADLHYHPRYNVWLRPDGEGVVTFGATAYGVALAGEFVSFMAKPAGTRVERDRAIGMIELWKTMVSVRTPVAGRLLAANDAVTREPALINSDPYGAGWLVRLHVDAWNPVADGLVTDAGISAAFEAEMALDDFEAKRGLSA